MVTQSVEGSPLRRADGGTLVPEFANVGFAPPSNHRVSRLGRDVQQVLGHRVVEAEHGAPRRFDQIAVDGITAGRSGVVFPRTPLVMYVTSRLFRWRAVAPARVQWRASGSASVAQAGVESTLKAIARSPTCNKANIPAMPSAIKGTTRMRQTRAFFMGVGFSSVIMFFLPGSSQSSRLHRPRILQGRLQTAFAAPSSHIHYDASAAQWQRDFRDAVVMVAVQVISSYVEDSHRGPVAWLIPGQTHSTPPRFAQGDKRRIEGVYRSGADSIRLRCASLRVTESDALRMTSAGPKGAEGGNASGVGVQCRSSCQEADRCRTRERVDGLGLWWH